MSPDRFAESRDKKDRHIRSGYRPEKSEVLSLVTTTRRNIVLLGGAKAMADLWLKGIHCGLDYNSRQGDMLAAYLAKVHNCAPAEAWAAMRVWAESKGEE